MPSITELLCDLGLQSQIVGCTKFCVHPASIKQTAAIVGGTKQFHRERVKGLYPDLIIANKEENNKDDIQDLNKSFSVYTSDVKTREDSFQLIKDIGLLFGRMKESNTIIQELKRRFDSSESIGKGRKVVYLIWQKPYMTIGGDTFINDMLKTHGFENAFGGQVRYPEITIEDILRCRPDVLLLSSEPFPFKEMHVRELQKLIKGISVHLVDGEYFSWYGSRQLHCSVHDVFYPQLEHLK